MKKYIILTSLAICLWACQEQKPVDKAQAIIDACIQAHGSKLFDRASIEFKFRDRNYKSSRKDGLYSYSRFWDSAGVIIHDQLTNTEFTRHIGEINAHLTPKKMDAFISSVNAVFYFFALPFNLNDPGVIKEYLGEVTLQDKRYDKIRIRFTVNPGDRMIHDDTYIYWIDQKDHWMDYIAYAYTEPDEEDGVRFRVAINRRKINGLTVQDYINYKPISDSIQYKIEDLDQAWAGNQLKELSKIINENVRVTLK
jgi:hypothetical protein